nr:hypothetical protein [Tanacetum cinerariifolium]
EDLRKENECNDQEKEDNVNNTNNVNTVSSTVNAAGTYEDNKLPFDPNMPALEDVSIFNFSSDDEDDGAMADMNNLDTIIQVSPTPTIRIHKDHPLDQVIKDLQTSIQTIKMSRNLEEHGFVSTIKQRTNHKDLHNRLFACFLSHEEPKKNPPYKFTWADKEVPISEGSPVTTTETYMDTYKNVSQDIRDQLNTEAEAVQIILTGIDNDIYSTIDACPNACEMRKAIERLKQGESINVQDLETNLYWEFGKFTSQDVESLESYYSRSTEYENQRIGNVVGARETVGSTVVQKSGIQCYNCKEYGHVSREYAPDSGPIFDVEPLQKVSNNDLYNVFAIESKHPEQFKSVHDTYLIEQDEHNLIIDSLDMSYDRKQIDQNDDDNDLANERELLAFLIKKLKCEIDDNKNRNKFLETSTKVLVEKLKGEIKDFKNKKHKDLKAQLQDKGIVISELKKLIEKLKGKSVDTKFGKSSFIRQPNAFKSQRPSILGESTIFLDYLKRKVFSKSKSVTQNNVSNDFSKTVTAQTLPPNKNSILKNTNVLASTMYKLHTEPTQARTSQLPQDYRKSNKREVEDQRRNVTLSKNKTSVTACNDSLNAKTLNVNFVCATCGKCVLNEKHDRCVLKSHNSVNSRTKMPIAVPVSSRQPKRIIKQSVTKPIRKPVDSESNQKPRNITRKLYERVSKACSWWYPKFTPSGYKWKPKSGKENVNLNFIEIFLFIVDSGCSKHMIGNLKLLINFMEKFLGTVKFGNDQIAPILGYGDLVQEAVMIKRSRAYKVFNKRTRVIVETIHVNFDELPQMVSDHVSSDPVTECPTTALEHDSLSPGLQCQENVVSKSSAVTTADALNQRQQHPLNN